MRTRRIHVELYLWRELWLRPGVAFPPSPSPELAPLRMAARKMDGLPLEMNRLFPTFPSLPALNHFAAAAGIEAAARLRDAIEGRRKEKEGEGGRKGGGR